jgi:hypothetical protein
MLPRQLFKGELTVVYHERVRDITVVGSDITNGLLKVIDHTDGDRPKSFKLSQLKKENAGFIYIG